MVQAREGAVMRVGKVNDAEPVELSGQPLQPDRDLFERKAVRLVDGMLGDARKVPGKQAERPVGGSDVIETLCKFRSSCGGGFQSI
jgi:hypothetical protein